MDLTIDGERSCRSVQSEFTSLYPFLKIDFFRTYDGSGRSLSRPERVSPHEPLRRFVRDSLPVTVNVEGGKTVSQVIKSFEEALPSLSAAVFRKSGTLWIETTLTSDWTLDRQNREGEHLSKAF